MGRRWGRADISSYADRFDVPAADGGLSVTFLGVASLLVSDGTSAVLTDGFFSRPSLPRVLLRRIAPDPGRIHEALGRAGVTAVDAVVPVHTHYDHALDSATVAAATGARLLGGASAAHIGVGGGLPEDRIAVVPPGRPVACGRFTLTLIESTHCPPDRYSGVIERPVVPPVRTSAYRCGEAWSILLEHASGRTALIQGSAGFVGGALTDRTAEVAYLGIGQLGHQDPGYIREYWRETVQVVGCPPGGAHPLGRLLPAAHRAPAGAAPSHGRPRRQHAGPRPARPGAGRAGALPHPVAARGPVGRPVTAPPLEQPWPRATARPGPCAERAADHHSEHYFRLRYGGHFR